MIDEFRLDLHPYVAGEWYPLFDDIARSYPLDLVSSSDSATGPSGCTQILLDNTDLSPAGIERVREIQSGTS